MCVVAVEHVLVPNLRARMAMLGLAAQQDITGRILHVTELHLRRSAHLELLVRLPDGLTIGLLTPLMPVLSEEPHCLPIEQEQGTACTAALGDTMWPSAACGRPTRLTGQPPSGTADHLILVFLGTAIRNAAWTLADSTAGQRVGLDRSSSTWWLQWRLLADFEVVSPVVGEQVHHLLIAQPTCASLGQDVTQGFWQLLPRRCWPAT